jgi:hypothetical protein
VTDPRTREALSQLVGKWRGESTGGAGFGSALAICADDLEALLASLDVRGARKEEKNDDFGLLGSTAGANSDGLTPRRED